MQDFLPGLLVVISGPSGVGKGTICEELLKTNENLTYSVSATTRPRRKGEVDGQHYFFLTQDAFNAMVQTGAFLEYTRVFGEHSYGTPRQYALDKLNEGKDVILEIDVQGGLHVQEAYPDAVLIFIAPPSMDELKRRLIERGTETDEDIARRTQTAYEEMACISYYDYVVLNDTVESAMEGISAIIHAEKSRVKRRDDLITILLEGRDQYDELSWGE